MQENELTKPIVAGRRIVLTEGEIVLSYRTSILFKVAKISYEKFDDEEYQYSIEPYYDVIDGLPSSIFQGIPGIDLSLRRPVYYRVNMTPVYVTERSPSESREGLKALLKEAGMSYLNRLEWMVKTNHSYMGDSFLTLPLDYPYETTVQSGSLLSFLSCVLKLLGSRTRIEIMGVSFRDEERPTLIKAYLAEYMDLCRRMAPAIALGQRKAKSRGAYRGRKRLVIDALKLDDLTAQGKSEAEIAHALGVSRTTLYRYRKRRRD
jgi:hypothetical protein